LVSVRRVVPAVSLVVLLGWLDVVGAPLSMGCKRSSGGVADGPTLFASACARCHGATGGGGPPGFGGAPGPRNFCEPQFHRERTDPQLRMTIVNGKGAGMPAFGSAFDDAQLDALVAHVRSFDPSRAPSKPEGTTK